MIPGDNLSWSNWSGSVETKLKAILRPRTKEELQDVIRSAPGPLRLVGSGHSFTPLVSTPGTIVDLSALSGLIDHDSDALTATIGAGTKLGSLTELLAGIGQALPNMGDIDKQSVAGALGTATHGSGLGLGAYHTLLKGMQFIDGRGTHREFTAGRDDEMIHATGVTLGSFGALTAVTFQNVPAYNLRRKRTMLSIGNTLENFESLMSAHRSAEIFFVPFANHALFQTLDITDEPGDFQVTSEDEDGLATLKKSEPFCGGFPACGAN